MNVITNIRDIASELNDWAQLVNDKNVNDLPKLMIDANRIFVAGSGRSGFMGRAFANRLMHLGLNVYFVGETTTPSIRVNDLLIILSGSGTTASHVNNAEKAKSEGAKLATITIFPENTIGKLADITIKLPGVTDKVSNQNDATTIQPLGSMFEQLTLITCDAVVMTLKELLQQTQEDMGYRHANME